MNLALTCTSFRERWAGMQSGQYWITSAFIADMWYYIPPTKHPTKDTANCTLKMF